MRARAIHITDTTLRDGHQSLWATRMRTQDMVPILEAMDDVGFQSLECWGGATFDACLRFLDEDPWDRLRVIKNHVSHTPLQMLLRGQNLVGYRHYGDDIVRRFVLKAAENGIDVFRVFDALNDTRNFETAAAAIKEAGKHFQAAVVYTISPVHSQDHYLEVANRLVEMGADSICIKDMAALLSPFYAEQLIRRFKSEIPVPIQLHCHYIGGLAPMTYLKAIEAGVDVIDTATVPLAFGLLSGKHVNGPAAGTRFTLFDNFAQRYRKPNADAATREYVALANEFGISPAKLAIAFVRSRWFVASTIVGATTRAQLEENLGSLDVSLDTVLLARIDAIHTRYPNPAP